MRLDWLEDIVAVVDTGSLSAAAQLRLVTQPAFSRRIQKLEEILGFPIVDRSGKPVTSDKIIDAHAERIRTLAHQVQLLVADLKRESKQDSDYMTIASQHSITASVMPQIIGGIRETDHTHIRMRSANFDECHVLLLNHQADLILTYQSIGMGQSANRGEQKTDDQFMGLEDFIPVCRHDAKETVENNLAKGRLPCVAYPRDVFLGKILYTQVLPKLGDKIHHWPMVETALTLAALQLCRETAVPAWVPRSLARHDIRQGNLVDLRPLLPHASMKIIAQRLFGKKNALEQHVWAIIQAMSTAPSMGY